MSASVTVFSPVAAPRKSAWRRVWAAFRAWRIDRQARRMLAEMDDHMLADIGASRADAAWEASRALWELNLRR